MEYNYKCRHGKEAKYFFHVYFFNYECVRRMKWYDVERMPVSATTTIWFCRHYAFAMKMKKQFAARP
jgi:hypothetical protein